MDTKAISTFNGAITFSLWKYEIEEDETVESRPFNGAITFSLWKFSKSSALHLWAFSLQWSHNFFVMEIMIFYLLKMDILVPSMEP